MAEEGEKRKVKPLTFAGMLNFFMIYKQKPFYFNQTNISPPKSISNSNLYRFDYIGISS